MLYGETGAENIVYKDKANVLLVNNTAEFKIRTFKTKISAKSEIIFLELTPVVKKTKNLSWCEKKPEKSEGAIKENEPLFVVQKSDKDKR